MRVILGFILLLPATVWAASASQHLQQHLASLKTYQAQFKEADYAQDTLQAKKHGQFLLKRPGFFKWETFQPTHQILLVQGQNLSIYDVDLAQVTKKKITKQQDAGAAALLTQDTQKLIKNYKVRYSKQACYTLNSRDKNTVNFVLKPIESGGFKQLKLCFFHGTLVGMQILNNLNQLTDYQFTHIKLNHPIKQTAFKLTLKPGVTVIG